jgi:hypothetical protein
MPLTSSGAERGEHAGVFTADDAGADHRQGARQLIEREDVVAHENPLAVERDVLVPRGGGAGGNDDELRTDLFLSVRAGEELEIERVRPGEGRLGPNDLDAVAGELMTRDIDLVTDDVGGAEEQIAHRDVLLDAVGRAIDAALTIAGQMKDGLAEGFGGDGSGVDADPANSDFPLDNGDALVKFCRLDCGPLPGGAGADDQKIVVVFVHKRTATAADRIYEGRRSHSSCIILTGVLIGLDGARRSESRQRFEFRVSLEDDTT